MSADELQHFRDGQLRRVVRHAFEHVPFYRKRFKSAGLHPEDVRTADDLRHLPQVTRSDVQDLPLSEILAEGTAPQDCRIVRTTGSSGRPLCVYLNPREAALRAQQQFRALLAAGFRWSDRLVVLGPEPPHRIRFHQRLGLYYSENLCSVTPIEHQVDRLKVVQPTIFWAYPIAFKALLHRLGDELGSIVQPRIYISSSEVCDALLRQRAQELFHAEVFNFYGAAEIGRIAAECTTHEGLHVNEDHLILEVQEDGAAVVTALHAYTMPFIRYRLGDLITMAGKPCSCGCPFALIGTIRGRDNDMIRMPDGRLLPPHGCDYILRRHSGILQFRFVQKAIDLLQLQIATSSRFHPDAIEKIRPALREYLGGSIRLEIEQVPFISEDGRKFKAYVSEMAAEQ